MTDELKPVRCGCGGDWSIWISSGQKSHKGWYVQCEHCGIRTEGWNTKQEAIEAWNLAMKGNRKMNTEDWHDLRKVPDYLPETTDTVWVILKENPTEVEMDSYDPKRKGTIMHTGSGQYESSGWWAYDEPGMVTHWMYMEVPEPPTERNDD